MTDKQRAILTAISPITAAIFFTFAVYASREFVSSVRADQAVHAQQIRELEQTVLEKGAQIQVVDAQMRDVKDTLRRIENKIDNIK